MAKRINSTASIIILSLILCSCSTSDKKLKSLIQDSSSFALKYSLDGHSEDYLTQLVSSKKISEHYRNCLLKNENSLDQLIILSYRDNNNFYKTELANCYLFLNDHRRAILTYSSLLAEKLEAKTKSHIFNNMGLIFSKSHYYQQAVLYFELSIKNNNSNDLAKYNLALTYLKIGKIHESENLIFQLFQKYPKDKLITRLYNISLLIADKKLSSSHMELMKSKVIDSGILIPDIIKNYTPQENLSLNGKLIEKNIIQEQKEVEQIAINRAKYLEIQNQKKKLLINNKNNHDKK